MTPTIRESKASDLGYVVASWCRASYELVLLDCERTKRGRPPAYALYRTLFEAVQEKLMKKSKTIVAVNPDDDDQILGCLVYEPGATPVIHYAGSKRDFAELDVNTRLYTHAGISYDEQAIHSGGMPPRREVDAAGSISFHCRLPKPWIYVPFGLMP